MVVMNTTLLAITTAGTVSILCLDKAHAAKTADAIEKFCHADGSYLLESDVVIVSGTFGMLCADVLGFEVRENGQWAGGLVSIAL